MEIAFDQVAPYVKKRMQNDSTGHGFDHVERVVNNVQAILVNESQANALIALTAAYLHDLIDTKLVDDRTHQVAILKTQLQTWHYSAVKITAILAIIEHMSFSDNLAQQYELSVEGQIVQDADRLDAIGAIGIARAFYYGGHVGERMYDPNVSPRIQMTLDEYRAPTTVVNHFYEKLLLIKNSLNTDTAREMARVRQRVMQNFLTEFKVEWGS